MREAASPHGEDASRLRALVAPSNRPEGTSHYPLWPEFYFPVVVGFLTAKEPLAGVVISGIGVSSVAFLILASIF